MCPCSKRSSKKELNDLYTEFYREERFVTIQDGLPSTKQVLGSNRCAIGVAADERSGYAVICSVIDNLVKGMAGQAIQNMNLMAGISEEAGLPMDGMWP